MTPKEKAQELVQRFTKIESFHIHERVIFMPLPEAKQCALIAVDEMIIQNGELYLNGLDGIYYREKNSYLFEVKQEIEAL